MERIGRSGGRGELFVFLLRLFGLFLPTHKPPTKKPYDLISIGPFLYRITYYFIESYLVLPFVSHPCLKRCTKKEYHNILIVPLIRLAGKRQSKEQQAPLICKGMNRRRSSNIKERMSSRTQMGTQRTHTRTSNGHTRAS